MSERADPAPAPRRGRRRRADAADDFRLMADSSPVMIRVSGADRRCVYVNRPWLEFTGRTLDDSIGTGWSEAIHAEDRERVLDAQAGAFSKCAPFELEYRLRRRDGAYRWLLDKGVPVLVDGELDGFIGSCIDITDRMAAEQAARRREEHFKTLAENIPDVIVRVDRARRCLYANPAVKHAFGLEPEDLIGRSLDSFGLREDIATPFTAAAEAALGSGTEQAFRFQAGADGSARHFAGRVIPERDSEGRVEAVLAIAYDVTDRELENERRSALLERERQARATAESATLARDQFLAIVSHELRSPLNGIKSWTHVLDGHLRDPDPTVRRALAGIMIGVEHQVRLIDDLLDVTRALSGNLGLVKQAMPLVPVLAEAVESMRAAALEKGLRVITEYAIGAAEIHGDADRIRQVFVNLLTNAIKFTPSGGTIRVSADVEDSMARIAISDDGAGIPAEFLPYLFDPFRQADQGSSRRSQEGLGLGLALVQRLAELHGGYATCQSEGVNRGSTFQVYLPLLRESGARVTLEHPAGEGSGSALPSLSRTRILLIDDQREARESLAALLAQAGAEVTAAGSCQEALAHLAISERDELPQVIVCDIAMPGEDGFATLRRIRAWESTRGKVPVSPPAIALSAYTQREDRLRALAAGFQMHLTKPVAPAELITVLSSVAHGMRV
jgi:PAS domain S-box-containing protein